MCPLVGSKMKCGLCGVLGHNRRSCGGLIIIKKRKVTCGVCGEEGHNRRSCLKKNQLCIICDEEAMEVDFVLTPSPRSPEVDIATPDWGNLPRDVVDIILGKVEEYNTEYWEGRVWTERMDRIYGVVRGEVLKIRRVEDDPKGILILKAGGELDGTMKGGGVAAHINGCMSDLRQIILQLQIMIL